MPPPSKDKALDGVRTALEASFMDSNLPVWAVALIVVAGVVAVLVGLALARLSYLRGRRRGGGGQRGRTRLPDANFEPTGAAIYRARPPPPAQPPRQKHKGGSAKPLFKMHTSSGTGSSGAYGGGASGVQLSSQMNFSRELYTTQL